MHEIARNLFHNPALRPEIEAFVQAAKTLIALDMLTISLMDEEMMAISECLDRLDEQFFSPH
jgi:hypothetical protein